MKTAEMKFMVSGGRITSAQIMPDGCCVLTVEMEAANTSDTTCHQWGSVFKKVPASELRLDDEFLKYRTKTEREDEFKELITSAIKSGLKDFWSPIYAPSFGGNGHICYEQGKMPLVGNSYNGWRKNAKDFCPERGSRLGTKTEYIAFLAVLIKQLVASGKSVAWAWNAVCNDSKDLGHYCNSNDAKNRFEPTGSREICGWYDLANCYKIIADDKEGGEFWLAGSSYGSYSIQYPLADLHHEDKSYGDSCDLGGCGWIVFDRCPE